MKEAGVIVNQSGIVEVLTDSRRLIRLEYYIETPLNILEPKDLEAISSKADEPFAFVHRPFLLTQST